MRRFLGELATFVAILLAIPVGLELALRTLDVRLDVPVFAPVAGTPLVHLARNPQFRTPLAPEPNREFEAVKPSGTFRIFVVGESETAGVPYGTDFAFSTWLAKRLAAETRGTRWEVVNAAIGGVQSWSALAIVREIARYEPDLLVVYLGHNETGTRFTASERRWLDPRGFAWRAWLLDTRVYEALQRLLPARAANQLVDVRSVQRTGSVDPTHGTRLHATSADRELSAAMYRMRLAEIVRTMRAGGARTMLLTLSQNFSEWAPAASSHRPGMSPAEKHAWRTAVRSADALAPQDCAQALPVYERALAIDAGYAALQFKIASCERTLGRLEAARARFRLASDLDRLPQGAPTTFNAIIRDVAAREGAIVVDVEATFERTSGPRLVGDDLFVEALHLNIRGHQVIAAAVADAIRAAGLGGPTVRWLDAGYRDPDPDALRQADPELVYKETLARKFACRAAGRPDCAP